MSVPATDAIKQLLRTPEPPMPGPEHRSGTQAESTLNEKLDALFKQAQISPVAGELIRALILLWHDHLDASHDISQGIENADGSYLHAILHRREPDYWNSKYWFRRVGAHPAFPEIGRRVNELLQQNGAGELCERLVPGGKWDASAFVEACEKQNELRPPQRELLREIQRIEFEILLDRFLQGASSS